MSNDVLAHKGYKVDWIGYIFFESTAPTEIYTGLIVGSVRCV